MAFSVQSISLSSVRVISGDLNKVQIHRTRRIPHGNKDELGPGKLMEEGCVSGRGGPNVGVTSGPLTN
jgi:hypothetical protein